MPIELPLLTADPSDPILILMSIFQIIGIGVLIRLGFLFADGILFGIGDR